MRWIVAMTKPNSEAIAAANLRRQDYEHYYPRYIHTKLDKTTQVRPLFPRYMFVHIDHTWYSIRGTRGVSSILMNDSGPQTIADTIIDNLRAREGRSGLIELLAQPKFLPGEAVKAIEGPFQGRHMIYEGQSATDRVHVLMDLLGMKVRAEIEERHLAAA